MANEAEWAILENNWPQSLNQGVEWVRLRKGECSAQDMVSYERDGVLSYSVAPQRSVAFIARRFVDPDYAGDLGDDKAKRVWAYGRWWRVSPDYPYRFEYTDVGQADSDTFEVVGYDDFNQDGDDPIRMVVPDGEGRWFILKDACGYTLTNANGSSSSFRKSSAYFGIGNANEGQWYSNAVIAGNVVTSWNGNGEHGFRHYMWDGRNGSAELSRNVRDLAAMQSAVTRCELNWSQNLVIAGNLVYDLELKRVYYFSGAQTASMTTRPYFDVQFNPIIVRKFSFICTGKSGSFDVTMEYGQSEDDLHESKKYTVSIKDSTKKRFRHVWELPRPVTTRVFRLKIENVTGTGISQIEVLSSRYPNPESWDDVS
jgi:hypothetical protein